MRFQGIYTGAGTGVETLTNVLRLRDATGALAGTSLITKPAVGIAAIARVTALADLGHFERMDRFAKAGRRAAAVLFSDLESSSPLPRGCPPPPGDLATATEKARRDAPAIAVWEV